MSFSRCFRHYKAAKEEHSGPDAFIINGRDRTFNLPFLKSFFTLACNGTTLPSAQATARAQAMAGPTAAQWLSVAVAKREVPGGK
eukprot:5750-Heterococcus_DN1.PRE.1